MNNSRYLNELHDVLNFFNDRSGAPEDEVTLARREQFAINYILSIADAIRADQKNSPPTISVSEGQVTFTLFRCGAPVVHSFPLNKTFIYRTNRPNEQVPKVVSNPGTDGNTWFILMIGDNSRVMSRTVTLMPEEGPYLFEKLKEVKSVR
jgi:hypothetical protein